jgi:phosphopantothenoylcysteine decarboxylase/phosphopantothenate--cysteine ligase
MGLALADAAVDYGAEVELVLGPVNITLESDFVKVINVVTAESMATECLKRFKSCDIVILSAAVADFTPEEVKDKKIKKDGSSLLIRLKQTADIAGIMGKSKKRSQLLVGFALETNNEMENAKEKLLRKNLDFIVLNSLNENGAGFGYDTNKITIIDRNNKIDKFELKSKEEAAIDILNKIVSMIK